MNHNGIQYQISVETKWTENDNFIATVSEHEIPLSANPNYGSSPKQLLLAALAGCTGIDVVDMLRKMRVSFDSFLLKTYAHQTEEHPKIYDHILIIYTLYGKNINIEKVKKAVQLSKEKYCGVSAMLAHSSNIYFEIEVFEQPKEK